MAKKLGDRPFTQIEYRRRQKGLSQQGLAKLVNMTQGGTITRIEHGYIPGMDICRKIAEALDCEVSDLWEIELIEMPTDVKLVQ